MGKRYFIELTQSQRGFVDVVERYEAATEGQAVETFEKIVKKARTEKACDGARICYGYSSDFAEIVETWARW